MQQTNWEFRCCLPDIVCLDTEGRSNQSKAPHPLDMATKTLRVASADNPLRCAILISGSGSGMEAMLHHQQVAACLHTTCVVISNKPDVLGIERAKTLNTPTVVIELPIGLEGNARRLAHELAIETVLNDYSVELVILSGYMRLLSPEFVERWEDRVINIHPSLLPAFPGAHAHRDVIAAGATKSGCSVHYVDAGMDTGKVIAQYEVDVLPNDTESTLSSRIKRLEHKLYPMVIDAIASGDFSNLPGN